MRQQSKRIAFDDWERENNWDIVNLGPFGLFKGEFVDYGEGKIYGWWYPTYEIAREYGVDIRKTPFWASIFFVMDDDVEEDILARDDDIWASDFIDAPWELWAIVLETKETPM